MRQHHRMAATSFPHYHFRVIIALSFLLFSDLHYCWNSVELAAATDATTTKVYIVYLGENQQENPATIVKSHHDLLATFLGSKEAAKNSIIYSYKHGFSGFAASLSESQAKAIADMPGVVLVFPNRIHKIHTTRSWDFLRLSPLPKSRSNLLSEANMGDGTIIGIIDSGIWPELQSFRDNGMGPIPARWKGICQTGQSFKKSNCNRKVIGARWFSRGYVKMYGPINTTRHAEYLSARDKAGHGTHCASIAAGRFVANASYLGLASGLARGGAPLARLAIYKVVWFGESTDADLLMAFDTAIHDGVDILSVSLGRSTSLPLKAYFEDGIAIGSFHAVARGIPVVSSAGNSGPSSDTVANTAPWMITVGATTIDRSFDSAISLGNSNSAVTLESSNNNNNDPTAPNQNISPQNADNDEGIISIVSEKHTGAKTTAAVGNDPIEACSEGSLNATLVKGKVVHCFLQPNSQRSSTDLANVVAAAGGVGVVYTQAHNDILTRCIIPCLKIDFETGTNVNSYVTNSRSPVMRYSRPQTVVGKKVSPFVASFSSRGPNSLLPQVLKPDITAPGVNILGAYPPPITGQSFEIMSGTSMACPHVAGVAALLKTVHRNWSPAAIKSAIMTTALQSGTDGRPILAQGGNLKMASPFDMGGGNIYPMRVSNPGLIYNIRPSNYIQFLCSNGYTNAQMVGMTGRNDACSRSSSSLDLNLPSISIPYLENPVTVTRTVTNVGPVNSTYRAYVVSPPGIGVKVEPHRLAFTASTTVRSFKVTFNSTQKLQIMDYAFGSLSWTDRKHLVRIPLVVRVAHQYSISKK